MAVAKGQIQQIISDPPSILLSLWIASIIR